MKNLGERILVPYPVESQRFGIERHEDRMGNRRTFALPAGRHIGTGRRLQLTSRTPRVCRLRPRR